MAPSQMHRRKRAKKSQACRYSPRRCGCGACIYGTWSGLGQAQSRQCHQDDQCERPGITYPNPMQSKRVKGDAP